LTADIDFSNVPIIDAHCHSFLETPKKLSGEEFARYASIAAQPAFLEGKFVPNKMQLQSGLDRLSTMYKEQPFLRYMVHLLSRFLECEDALDVVSRVRSSRAERNFRQYVKDLFSDVGIRGLVMDGGYPPLTDEDVKEFPATVAKIFRLDTFLKELLASHKDFEELCVAYESGIREAVKNGGYVGLKSIIAYRTGLKIQRVERTDAQEDFQQVKSGRAERAWFGPKVKRLRDFLFVRGLELSIELGVPMQIHTGVGDYDIVLDQCDPALLYDLLKDDKLRHATVVLVHSGYPNNPNVAYMASVLPNVFLDFSLTIPFLNPTSHCRLMEILQVAPNSKIMYGSDAFNLPELIWLGAKVGRSALSKCLAASVRDGLFSEDEAGRIAKRILFENANELYRLRIR
jgi:predicted TIM-barrel fold metal-dependent hydrolase